MMGLDRNVVNVGECKLLASDRACNDVTSLSDDCCIARWVGADVQVVGRRKVRTSKISQTARFA